MELNRLQKLAGLPLTESKKTLEESKTDKIEIHFSDARNGQFGDMVTLDGSVAVGELAKMLGIPDGWKKTKIGKVWASFNDGDRLCFFTDGRDYMPDGDDED